MIERWIVDNEPSPKYPIYTRGNIGEVFPWPVSPLSWTLAAIPGSEPGWRDAFVRFGAFDHDEFSDDQIDILGCFGGYGYLNVSVSRVFGVRTPGLTPEQIDYSLWGEMPGVPPYRPGAGDESAEHSARIQATLQWILTAEELPELLEDQRAVARLRAERPDAASMSDADLVAYARGLVPEFRRLFSRHLFTSYCATVPLGIIQQVCQQLGDLTLPMRLVAGIGDVDSAAPSMAMWALSRQVAASPALTAAFDAGVHGVLERVAGEGDFVRRFDELLYDFGSRGPNEWETSSPSWETRPELALAAIERMRLAADDQSPRAKLEALAAERESLGVEVAERLAGDPETQGQFVAALRAACVFLAGRERTKTNVIRLVNEFRHPMNELGRRMKTAGHFDRVESYAMVREDELDKFLDDPGAFTDTIRERERQYRELFEVEPPFVIDGTVPPLATWARRDHPVDAVSGGETLAGIPGCPGRARGTARVVLDPSDPSALEPGDVLVAPITDPAWTPLFVTAAAVVVDVGAQLSHAVIVSRELGIPCVVSVTDATRRIPDGTLVTVDGTTGTVTVEC